MFALPIFPGSRPPSIVGKRAKRCLWQIQRSERVAAVGERRRRSVAKDIRRAPQQGYMSLTSVFGMGNEPTAASGGRKEASEWQWSADEEAAPSATNMPGTTTGNRWTLKGLLCIKKPHYRSSEV